MLWAIRDKMRPALSVIDMIPDVHRTQALAVLRKTVIDRGFGKIKLHPHERDLAFYDGPQPIISPVGAKLLLALYKAGKIKLKKPGQKTLPTLEAYVATEPEFLELVAKANAEDAQKRARFAEIIADPSLAQPEEITAALVRKVFTAQMGHGKYGTLMIGGLECHKELVIPEQSEEDRMRPEPKELLWWFGHDGTRREAWI